MKAKKKRKKPKRYAFKIILVLAVLAYALFHYANQRKLLSELETQRANNEARIDSLQTEIATLEKEIEYSESLEFVEKVARDELGMVRPREIIYVDENEETSENEEEDNQNEREEDEIEESQDEDAVEHNRAAGQ